MSKSKFVIDKLVKLFEQGVISYNDLSSEVMNIMKISNFDLKHKKHCADFDKSVQFSKVYNFVFEKE